MKLLEKKAQIVDAVSAMLVKYGIENKHEVSEIILDSFFQIPPQARRTQPLQYMSRTVTIRKGGEGGGVSVKPGNIQLNWKALLVDGSESILAAVGTVTTPWLIPLAGLVIFDKVMSMLRIDISERHAVVVWGLWYNKDDDNQVKESVLLKMLNKELVKYNRWRMDQDELSRILSDLERIKCISRGSGDIWSLRETINISSE